MSRGAPGRPMLAVKGDAVPAGPGWVHEVKWDGMRTLLDVRRGEARVWSRTERDVSVAFPELVALGSAYDDLLIDGEVVRLGDDIPSLGAIADRIHLTSAPRAAALARTAPVTLLAFDVLRHDEHDLSREPWSVRRDALESLGLDDVSWQVPPTYADGASLRAAAEQQGLEGIVSKQVDARYEWGARSRSWLKFPNRPTGTYLVGGYRFEVGSDHRLGAVLVGQAADDGLVYRGRVGSGLAGRAGRVLSDLLAPLVRATSPFVDVPRLDAAGTVWVEPVLSVDVAYLRVTGDGRLRQPSYRGIRSDA